MSKLITWIGRKILIAIVYLKKKRKELCAHYCCKAQHKCKDESNATGESELINHVCTILPACYEHKNNWFVQETWCAPSNN